MNIQSELVRCELDAWDLRLSSLLADVPQPAALLWEAPGPLRRRGKQRLVVWLVAGTDVVPRRCPAQLPRPGLPDLDLQFQPQAGCALLESGLHWRLSG